MLYYFGNKAPLIFSFMKSQICKGSDNYSLYFSNLSQSLLWLLYSSDLYSKFRKTPKSKANLKTHKPVCAQSVQIIPGFVCLELECLNSTLNSSLFLPLFSTDTMCQAIGGQVATKSSADLQDSVMISGTFLWSLFLSVLA